MIARLLRSASGLPDPLRRLLRRVPGLRRSLRALLGHPRGSSPPPGSKRPVVYLPTWLRWSSMRQRPQYLMAAFAKAGHPTYFVDPRSTASVTPEGVRIVTSLRGVPGDHPILYAHYAGVHHLFERFLDPVVVYDLLDDLSIYDADEVGIPAERRVRAHHAVAVQQADIVIASSQVLVDKHSGERSDLVLIENGVDPVQFGTEHRRPAELPTGRPIVGFHGAVADWFDFDLFESVARANPQWCFVVVGPVAPQVRQRVRRLGVLDNVDFVGERPSDDIAAYVRAFDVGTIWFVMNDVTSAVNPLKMFEYLAAGVPVVATPLPACRDVVGVAVAAAADGFAREIERALGLGAAERQGLVAVAEQASWDARIAPLLVKLADLGLERVPQ